MIRDAIKAGFWTVLGYKLSCGCFAFSNSKFLNRVANHAFCKNCDGRYFIIEAVYNKND